LRKNAYHLLFGPADETGSIEVTKRAVLNQSHEEMEWGLMDYFALEKGWRGEVSIRPVSLADIDEIRRIYLLHEQLGQYPPDVLEHLNRLEARLSERPSARLGVVLDLPGVTVQSVEAVAGE
jgi:hypothetical protein